MGGGIGGSRQRNADTSSQLRSNITNIRKRFPTSPGGYFGIRSTSSRTRRLLDENPNKAALQFFRKLSKGGKVQFDKKTGRYRAKFKDGSHITYRPTSNDGSPVVDMNLKGNNLGIAKLQKIHFESKK